MNVKWLLFDPDRRRRGEELRYSVRVYPLAELRRMLAAAGLTIVATWGSLAGDDYGLDAKRMVVLARLGTD